MQNDEFDEMVRRITDSFASTKGKLGASDSDWKIHASELQRISETLDAGGSVTLEELSKVRSIWSSESPFIDENGKPFVLYIKDHTTVQRYGNYRKFHVAWCDVMDRMERGGRFDRYHKKRNIENPSFNITLGPGQEVTHDLLVCKICLRHMTEIVRPKPFTYTEQNFDTPEFFTVWGKQNLKQPKDNPLPVNLPQDWEEISLRKRNEVNWKCQQCGKDFSNRKSELHVHHINGVKGDISDKNLKVLCFDCHSSQFHHSHMKKGFQVNEIKGEPPSKSLISLVNRMKMFISNPESYATGTEKASIKIRELVSEVADNKNKLSMNEQTNFYDAYKLYNKALAIKK